MESDCRICRFLDVDSRGRRLGGRFVAFDSDATNLVQGDQNNTTDVFRHDRDTGETILISVNSAGQQGDSSSHAPAISADGRFVVFHANSSLAPEDTNQQTDVYVRALPAHPTPHRHTP